ncbi:MAG: winged helix-turn-helix transcriptional regulator [Deltaproteobacteria bacterium]|nr:winged helix-turn-helix transcriptional regulator [Deltaproteobacteria bacterium]
MTQKNNSCKPANCLKAKARVFESTANGDQALAILAKAMGHPIRVSIIRMLLKEKRCVCSQIVDKLPLAQSTVSQHLKVLKDAGLIQGEIKGPSTCYCINRNGLKQLKKLVALF